MAENESHAEVPREERIETISTRLWKISDEKLDIIEKVLDL